MFMFFMLRDFFNDSDFPTITKTNYGYVADGADSKIIKIKINDEKIVESIKEALNDNYLDYTKSIVKIKSQKELSDDVINKIINTIKAQTNISDNLIYKVKTDSDYINELKLIILLAK